MEIVHILMNVGIPFLIIYGHGMYGNVGVIFLIKYRHCTYGIAGVPFLIKCGHCIHMVIVGVYTIFYYIWTLYVDVGVPVLIKYTLYGYIWHKLTVLGV